LSIAFSERNIINDLCTRCYLLFIVLVYGLFWLLMVKVGFVGLKEKEMCF
jgi:hypothetical protein